MDLVVYCFYLDFNGYEYGCVDDLFVFKLFEGEMDICSLEVYFMSYFDKKKFDIWGERFVDVISVLYMQYQGFMVGLSCDEVRQVFYFCGFLRFFVLLNIIILIFDYVFFYRLIVLLLLICGWFLLRINSFRKEQVCSY